jgi:hypothetical protein
VLSLFVLLGDLKVVHGTEEEPILLTTILWILDNQQSDFRTSFCQGQGTISQQGTNSRLNCSVLEANGKRQSECWLALITFATCIHKKLLSAAEACKKLKTNVNCANYRSFVILITHAKIRQWNQCRLPDPLT